MCLKIEHPWVEAQFQVLENEGLHLEQVGPRMPSVLSWSEPSQSWNLQTPEPDSDGNVPGPTELKVDQHPSRASPFAQLDHKPTLQNISLSSLSYNAAASVCQLRFVTQRRSHVFIQKDVKKAK